MQPRPVVERTEDALQDVKQPNNREVVHAETPPVITATQTSEPSTVSSASATIEKSEYQPQRGVTTSELPTTLEAERRSSPSTMASVQTAPAIARSDAVQVPAAHPGPDVVRRDPEVRSGAVPTPMASSRADAGTVRTREAEAKEPPVERARAAATMEAVPSEASRADARDATRSVASIPGGTGRGTGLDYGWLKRLLWESIDRVKQYSDDAVANEWEGRVVMAVTIRRDGRIDEVRVTESSGNKALDREAQELISRASPLVLDRALGAEQVRLRVPMSFGLE
jgi:TonB family protein